MPTANELNALRTRIAQILTTDPCQRISFSVPGCSLRAGGFFVIGTSFAIPHDPLHTAGHAGHARRPLHHRSRWQPRRPMHVRVARMPLHVGAMYYAESNSIVVPNVTYGVTLSERMDIVHEATHAVLDYQQVRLSAWEEESVAYIAGAVYRHLCGDRSSLGAAVFDIADSIVQDLSRQVRVERNWNAPAAWMPDATVTPEQMQRLVGAVRTDPAYAGIINERRNFHYRHDGGTL